MINFSQLYVSSAKLKKWEEQIKKGDKETHFLLLLAPLMEHLLLQLKQILAKYPKIQARVHADFMASLTYQLFLERAYIMIVRVCVLEMHVLARENLLIGETPEERFEYFLKVLQDPANALALIEKYPVIGEQLTIFVKQVLAVFDELFARLNQDYNELVTTFFPPNSSYSLSGMQTSGDRHNHGREVVILEFTQGQQKVHVLYKPKPLAVDLAFQNLLSWYNQKSDNLKLLTFKILDKKTYGWCEWVEYLPCQNKEEVKQFYYRAGIWMMFTYLLRGSDIHAENMIAHGAYPIIVDFECLFTPLFKKDYEEINISRFSVLHTLFLPHREVVDKEHEGYDTSALTEFVGQGFYYGIKWADVGKDSMHAERVRGYLKPLQNQPSLANEKINYLDYQEDFLQGFIAAYRFILKYKTELLGENSPLQQFKEVPVRVLLRGTLEYFLLLVESWHPKLLYTEKERNDFFTKELMRDSDYYAFYKDSFLSELKDLQEDNIPFFSALSTAKQVINSDGQPLALNVIKSGYEAVCEHIQQFINEDDLSVQTFFINNSFIAAQRNQQTDETPMPFVINKELQPLAFEALKKRALNVARQELNKLIKLKLVNGDNIAWPTVTLSKNDVWQAAETDLELYDGVAGIGLVFAYAAVIFKDDNYLQMAQLCWQTLHENLDKENREFLETGEIGGFAGVCGIVYVLAVFYRLWQDEAIKKDLVKLLETLPLALKENKTLDVVGGTAGAIAVLCSLQDIFPLGTLLPVIRACADHFLQQYPKPDEFPLAKEVVPGVKPLLGLSHGVAGMAWALHRYYLLEPREDIKQWITAALTYERAQFNQNVANWPDFRKDEQSVPGELNFGTTWCHGAPGIGLARLEMSKHWQDNEILQEIKIALETTEKTGFTDSHCLCHGNFGNLELFLSASLQANNPVLTQRYYQITAVILELFEKEASQQGLASANIPGLMTGTAGIIYQLLRIAYPEKIPSVLLLQSLAIL